MEEKEIDEEAVAGGGKLGGRVGGDVEFWGEETGLEGETVGIMEGAENEPDGLVAAFFSKELVQLNEALLGDAFIGYKIWRVLLDGRFDHGEIKLAKGLSKAFVLEVLNLFIAKIPVLIAIAQVEDALQGGDARRLQSGFFRVEKRRYRVGDGLLAEEEDFVDIVMLSSASADTRVYLLELSHYREHLFFDDLISRYVLSQV
ncbi:MAG: hypothetical protein L6R39_005475 [Caloplaca ligustica]|nr:MAG: hypothetical protein L6R39_005475 [Caloplaca ligustica]